MKKVRILNMELRKIKSYIAIWQDVKYPDDIIIWQYQKLFVRNDNFQIFHLTIYKRYDILNNRKEK